jgi:hypothetical protein
MASGPYWKKPRALLSAGIVSTGARRLAAASLPAALALFLVSLPLFTTPENTHLAGANLHVIRYSPAAVPIANPLMGWAPWATITESRQPHTLVYADLSWREFEPQQGAYDFAGFEEKHQLSRWRAENKKLVFRFVCDRPGEEDHLDIPDWLYQAMGGSGDRYDNAYGRGFSPDYTHPLFLQAHREAITALGERYGNDPFFAYVELGSLGHWGEWHVDTGSGIRRLPVEETRQAYVGHYRAAFPDTFLLMRRPFRIARQWNLGLYNDLTGDPQGTAEWLGWIARGGEYDQTGEEQALAPMPLAWRTAPIGGEQTGSLSDQALYETDLDQTIRLLERSHTTFIGPNSPYDVDPRSPLQAGLDRVMARIGYRIYVQEVRLPFTVRAGPRSSMQVSIRFANDGVAPLYSNWPARFYVHGPDGDVRLQFLARLDVREIQPGRPYTVTIDFPLRGLNAGTYALGFAITDPTSRRPAVRLAMGNPRKDFVQELARFEVVPDEVSNQVPR